MTATLTAQKVTARFYCCNDAEDDEGDQCSEYLSAQDSSTYFTATAELTNRDSFFRLPSLDCPECGAELALEGFVVELEDDALYQALRRRFERV